MIAKRKERIVARLTKSEKAMVNQAAKRVHKNITDFIRDAVFQAASEVIAGQNGHVEPEPYIDHSERTA